MNIFENDNNFKIDSSNNEINTNDKTIMKKNIYAANKPRKRKNFGNDNNKKLERKKWKNISIQKIYKIIIIRFY